MSAYRKEGTYEKSYATGNGIAMLLVLVVLAVAEPAGFFTLRQAFIWPAIGIAVAIAFIAPGFYMLQPNEAVVLTLFGDYLGTDRTPGLRWTPRSKRVRCLGRNSSRRGSGFESRRWRGCGWLRSGTFFSPFISFRP